MGCDFNLHLPALAHECRGWLVLHSVPCLCFYAFSFIGSPKVGVKTSWHMREAHGCMVYSVRFRCALMKHPIIFLMVICDAFTRASFTVSKYQWQQLLVLDIMVCLDHAVSTIQYDDIATRVVPLY